LVATSKLVGQIGNQLYTTFFLFDKAIANPDSANLLDYERMIDTDETVASGIDFMILCVLNKLDRYAHENPQIQDFVNDCLEGMQGSLFESVRDILSAIWAGYSGTEIVHKADGNRIVLDYLATYHPRTVYFNIDRQTGRLAEDPLMQWRWFDGSPVVIPRNKCLILTHNGRFGNPYGNSQLKRARKNWLLKDPALKMWVNGVDKYGTPLTAAMVPDGDIRDPDNPHNEHGDENLISNIEYMARVLANLQNGTGIAMASGTGDQKADLKFYAPGSGLGDAFERLILYLNKMIFRSLLVPSLVFDEGQKSGSYALGQSHFDMYNLMLNGIFMALKEALIEQLIRPLIEMNFGPQKSYGDFPERKVSAEDKEKEAKVFESLTNLGYLDPEAEEDMDYVRSSLGLPERKVDRSAKQAEIGEKYAEYLQEDGSEEKPPAKETA
jgi:hypothetical protein